MKQLLAGIGLATVMMFGVKAQETDWTGWYGGFSAGLLSGGYSDEFGIQIPYNGASIGAFAGYRYELRPVVIGIDAIADLFFTSSTAPSRFGLPDGAAGMPGRLSARTLLGFPKGKFLPYVAAGAAIATQRYSPFPSISTAEAHLGYQLAIGADISVSDNTFLRTEATYTRFRSETYDIGLGDWQVNARGTFEGKVGLGLRF